MSFISDKEEASDSDLPDEQSSILVDSTEDSNDELFKNWFNVNITSTPSVDLLNNNNHNKLNNDDKDEKHYKTEKRGRKRKYYEMKEDSQEESLVDEFGPTPKRMKYVKGNSHLNKSLGDTVQKLDELQKLNELVKLDELLIKKQNEHIAIALTESLKEYKQDIGCSKVFVQLNEQQERYRLQKGIINSLKDNYRKNNEEETIDDFDVDEAGYLIKSTKKDKII